MWHALIGFRKENGMAFQPLGIPRSPEGILEKNNALLQFVSACISLTRSSSGELQDVPLPMKKVTGLDFSGYLLGRALDLGLLRWSGPHRTSPPILSERLLWIVRKRPDLFPAPKGTLPAKQEQRRRLRLLSVASLSNTRAAALLKKQPSKKDVWVSGLLPPESA